MDNYEYDERRSEPELNINYCMYSGDPENSECAECDYYCDCYLAYQHCNMCDKVLTPADDYVTEEFNTKSRLVWCPDCYAEYMEEDYETAVNKARKRHGRGIVHTFRNCPSQ